MMVDCHDNFMMVDCHDNFCDDWFVEFLSVEFVMILC